MDFGISMNTKGACDLMAMAQGGNSAPAPQVQQPAQDNGWGAPQQPQNNNWGQNTQGYGQTQQAAPVQNNWNQPQQNNWNQPQQNNYQQPQQNNWNQPQAQPVQQAAPVQRPAGGGVVLKKGQKTSLTKMNPNLTEVDVCLGWSILNQACDLDTSAFMLGADGRVIGDDWFVFYGQPASPDGSIVHRGDSRDGAGAGDDEVITVKLNQVNTQVQKVVFVVTINEALERGLNFSMVKDAYVRIVDKSTGKELVKFNLTDYYASVTSMVVGELYKHNGEWRLNPVGDGVAKDLAGLCGMYGVNVAG